MLEGSSGVSWGLVLLAVVPLSLVLVTSFIKISVVLSLLRNALGAPEVPSTAIVLAISILLSAFVMSPVALATWREAQPVAAVGGAEGWDLARVEREAPRVLEPLRAWLSRNAGAGERATFVGLGERLHRPEDRDLVAQEGWLVIVPAFVLTELKEAFIIAFIVFVPFLVVDLVVASVLLSLNMHMVSPTSLSLPFKLLLFVMIDGWQLLVQGLVLGYA